MYKSRGFISWSGVDDPGDDFRVVVDTQAMQIVLHGLMLLFERAEWLDLCICDRGPTNGFGPRFHTKHDLGSHLHHRGTKYERMGECVHFGWGKSNSDCYCKEYRPNRLFFRNDRGQVVPRSAA